MEPNYVVLPGNLITEMSMLVVVGQAVSFLLFYVHDHHERDGYVRELNKFGLTHAINLCLLNKAPLLTPVGF